MEQLKINIKTATECFIGQSRGITTGFSQLDEALWGFQPKKLVVIGGRPGMGKSSILADMAIAVSTECPVGIFSFEMPREQISARLACNYAKLNYHSVRRNIITKNEKQKFDEAIIELSDRPIFIDYDEGVIGLDNYWMQQQNILIEQVVDSRLKTMVSKHGCKVVFIDYLQLMRHINVSQRDRRLEVGTIAEILRDYAKRYGITIVLLSQLRRFEQARYREDGKAKPPLPTMDDLKESGEIENHSDVVILLHRPQYYYLEKELDLISNVVEEDALLLIVKNRDGPDGAIPVNWLAYAMSYVDKNLDNGSVI